MDIVFLGTAAFACPSLEALAGASEHRIFAVVTQPDRPAGRGGKLTAPPVKETALRHRLLVLQPERVRDPSFVAWLRNARPELIVVIAYGQILPKEVLDLPRHGCVNVHGSLLPKYRGASPIQAALLHGETETGVTTMFMDEGLDTGDIILQSRVQIEPADDASTLQDRLAWEGAKLLLKSITLITCGEATRTKQDDAQATMCKKLRKEDGRIDWRMPAGAIWNRVRAFNPWPSAYCYLRLERGQKLVKIWEADVVPEVSGEPGSVVRLDKHGIVVATGGGGLRIRQLQMEGGRRQRADEFIRGHEVRVGMAFE